MNMPFESLFYGDRPPAPGMARDPVCGMDVKIADTSVKADAGGKTYYFCCEGCRDTFLAGPARFQASPPALAPAVAEATAKDPVCGMEVKIATARFTAE